MIGGDNLQDSQKERSQLSIVSQTTISGPLPPPDILQKYGIINPSFPERIVAMAEKEQNIVHDLRKENLELNKLAFTQQAESLKRGQLCALFLALLALSATVYLGINGHDWLAGGVFSVVLLGIIKEIAGSHKSSN
jgi:uncharacterized membrane protein